MGKAVLLPVSTVWGGAYLALAGDNLAIWPYMPAYSYLKPALTESPAGTTSQLPYSPGVNGTHVLPCAWHGVWSSVDEDAGSR
jgi:hypothetical protein